MTEKDLGGMRRNLKAEVTRRTFLGAGSAAIAGAAVTTYSRKAFAGLASSDPGVPVLLRISDAVKPGQLFSVNGEWLNAANVQVFVSSKGGATPPPGALNAPILQTDTEGHFVVATLPPQLPSGAYYVWVRNSTGYGAPIVINGPRPLFLSEYEAWEGQQIEIVGRNFDPAEFGAIGAPQVRLVNDNGNHKEAKVVSYNPFAITITVPQVEAAEYRVEVSTDGTAWWRTPADELLTVVKVGKDPLGLGVAWADHFHWHRVFDVTKYGVPASSGGDVTAPVQTVVNTAKAAGGGVVYFPEGQYQLSGIALPADIVLLGAGVENTFLISTAIGGIFINSSGDGTTSGHQGVAHLTIELNDPDVRPDTFMWLGEQWGQNNNTSDLTVRTASELFVKKVNLNYSLVGPTVTSGQRGLGIEWIGKARALCEDCNFVGYHAQPYINYITNYYTIRRNYFEYSSGNVVCNGSRCFYEHNHIVGHREYSTASGDYDLHGLFARDRAYMAHNTVEGVGSLVGNDSIGGNDNDGEALCVESPGATFNYGSVTGASVTTVTVDPMINPGVPLTSPLVYFGYLAVAIIDGTGLGQLRRVTNVDSTNNQLTVTPAWDIVPDSTSAFTLILPLEQVTYYANSISDCTKGYWFFGNTFDSVQADNKSGNSEGFFMWTVRNPGGFFPGYFARFARNQSIGISPKSQHGGINYNTGRFDQNGGYFGTMAYGVEMVDNFISGVPSAVPQGVTESTPEPGLCASGASYSSEYDGNPAGADGKNTVMARNRLTELTIGVYITHSLYGTVIADNDYTSTVTTFLQDTGSINTLLLNNTQV